MEELRSRKSWLTHTDLNRFKAKLLAKRNEILGNIAEKDTESPKCSHVHFLIDYFL